MAAPWEECLMTSRASVSDMFKSAQTQAKIKWADTDRPFQGARERERGEETGTSRE